MMNFAIPTGAAGAVTSVFGPVSPSAGEGSGFGDVLRNAINQISGMQANAADQVNAVMAGGNADMGKVMISVEKSDVAFQLMMQVRNKIVSAYQDIEKMQF